MSSHLRDRLEKMSDTELDTKRREVEDRSHRAMSTTAWMMDSYVIQEIDDIMRERIHSEAPYNPGF